MFILKGTLWIKDSVDYFDLYAIGSDCYQYNTEFVPRTVYS